MWNNRQERIDKNAKRVLEKMRDENVLQTVPDFFRTGDALFQAAWESTHAALWRSNATQGFRAMERLRPVGRSNQHR
jgi:hypothetical protein